MRYGKSVAIVGLLLISIVGSQTISPYFPDSKDYVSISENLYLKGDYSFDGISPSRLRMPIYPIFLVPFFQIPQKSVLILIAVQTVLNIGTMVLLLRIWRLLFREEYPVLLPFVLLGHVFIWINAVFVLTETLFTFLVTSALYFYFRPAREDVSWTLAFSGLFLGLAFLTRSICAGLILYLLIAIPIMHRNSPQVFRRLAVLAAAVAVTVVPWTVRNYVSTGRLTPTAIDSEYNFYLGTLTASDIESGRYEHWMRHENFDQLADSFEYRERAISNIRADVPEYLLRGTKRVADIWSHFPTTRDAALEYKTVGHMLQAGIILLAFLGLVKTESSGKWVLVGPAIGFTFVLFFTGTATTRHLLPAMPFVLILATKGILTVVARLKTVQRPQSGLKGD